MKDKMATIAIEGAEAMAAAAEAAEGAEAGAAAAEGAEGAAEGAAEAGASTASKIGHNILNGLINTGAFLGGSYLIKAIIGGGVDPMKEKIRHDKALEKYQRDMGEWEKKRQEYQDFLLLRRENRARAEKNLRKTNEAFLLYAKTHPDLASYDQKYPKPNFSNYYAPSKKQKKKEEKEDMILVGVGMLALTFVVCRVI